VLLQEHNLPSAPGPFRFERRVEKRLRRYASERFDFSRFGQEIICWWSMANSGAVPRIGDISSFAEIQID
jgi:hypothetical protein